MDIFKATKPTIAFLPLDLDYDLPDENEIIEYCYKNCLSEDATVKYGPCWLIIPVCGRFDPADWRNVEKNSHHCCWRYWTKDGVGGA